GVGDLLNARPHVGQAVRRQRYQLRTGPQPGADGALHIAQTDGTHLAVRLRDDHFRFQVAQFRAIDAIDREPFLDDRLDALIEHVTGAVRLELRLSAYRQVLDRLRIIAFVRTADDLVLEAEGADDFRGAGDERDNPR